MPGSAMPKKNKEPNWQNSEAKKLLLQDLRSGAIPLDSKSMSPKDAYLKRPEFAEFGGYVNFPSRLRSARQQIDCMNNRAATDSAGLAHDRRIYPKAAKNHRGEPRWEGSEAERLLRQDMDEGNHKKMKPELLYNTRKEYYENYPLKVFREHIHQEDRRRKFLAQYGSHKNQNKSSY
jgi:hypothetical protein